MLVFKQQHQSSLLKTIVWAKAANLVKRWRVYFSLAARRWGRGGALSRWSDFLCGIGSPIDFRWLTKGAIVLEPERLKSRQMILDKLYELGI